MRKPHVTFIIATFKRVEALRCTIRSLQLQTRTEWDAIVVGDCCGPETGRMIQALGDERICYYNFPERFGEQSGPNNFGLRLAKGEYVCFLNHDDLLLPDYLDTALQHILESDSDFHIALAANATQLETDSQGRAIPVFKSLLPACNDLSALIAPDSYLFDPSSFWLIRTAYAQKVGDWRHSSEIWRTPLRDWIMRAWRGGGSFSFGNTITGLRFWTQNLRGKSQLYNEETPEHQYMIQLIEKSPPEKIRELLLSQLSGKSKRRIALGNFTPKFGSQSLFTRIRTTCLTFLYLRFGIDPVAIISSIAGKKKGTLHTMLLHKRTGEVLPLKADLCNLLKDPEAHKIICNIQVNNQKRR